MDYTGYLENAHRKIAELHHEAEHMTLVKELKSSKESQKIAGWKKVLGRSLIGLGKRLDPTAMAH